MDYIDGFPYIKSSLHPWDEAFLVMMDDCFHVFSDSGCGDFIEYFFLLFIIGLETASLPLAALVAFDKQRYESHEAAIKYLLTAVFSSAIFMMGLSFVYALSGTLYFADIAASINPQNSLMLLLAIAFVIAGMGFKLSLVPFHLWTADVYQGAPTTITSYLSVISKGAAAFSFFVIMVQVFGPFYGKAWAFLMVSFLC